MRLTDLSIKALKAPENGACIYQDDTLTGFGVRITADGVRSWCSRTALRTVQVVYALLLNENEPELLHLIVKRVTFVWYLCMTFDRAGDVLEHLKALVHEKL